LGLVSGLGACIIPDRGIRTESDDDNPGAVRIVESIPILPELARACDDPEGSAADRNNCPQVPETLPQGLVPGGPYCLCSGGDRRTLAEFSIYAEDPDRRRDDPADTLYAVALLDLDARSVSPQNFVAYPEHLTPGGPGDYLASRQGLGRDIPLKPSIGREDNGLWRFRFGKDGGAGVDLCNDDNGETLAAGLHNLQIMVTDRPFYRPARLDENGDPVLGQGGAPIFSSTQFGMPDLAIGATWAVANYVFSCRDPGPEDTSCDCAEEAP